MEEDRIWLLVSKKIFGEITGPELLELEWLLKKMPALSYPVDLLINAFQKRPGNGQIACNGTELP